MQGNPERQGQTRPAAKELPRTPSARSSRLTEIAGLRHTTPTRALPCPCARRVAYGGVPTAGDGSTRVAIATTGLATSASPPGPSAEVPERPLNQDPREGIAS